MYKNLLHYMDTTAESLQYRVADFLRQYPPFSALDEEDLLQLALHCRIRFVPERAYVFREGEQPSEDFFVVQKGLIELLKTVGDQEQLIEICDEGDIFGVTALLAGTEYGLSARAREDTLLYAIPWHQFQPLIERYNDVAVFFAAGFAAGMQMLRRLVREPGAGETLELIQGNQPVALLPIEGVELHPRRAPVTVTTETSIAAAARLMTEQDVGSVIIADEHRRPLGIVTDTDLRRYVATGEVPVEAAIARIMHSPVVTVPPGISAADALILMMQHRIRHLCVTADGTDRSPALGMISERDLFLRMGNSPAVLVKEMVRARDVDTLAATRDRAEELLQFYIEHGVNIAFVTNVMTHINDALIQRAVQLVQQQLRSEGHEAPLPFCWLSMGSEGRKEQMLRTDLDNALVYADPQSKEEEGYAREYFLLFAERVIDILTQCGFALCPGGMMANNPTWCQPLSVWKKYFWRWMTEPDEKAVMHTTIFFDLRPVAGDARLAEALYDTIRTGKEEEPAYLIFLAKNALQNPPPLSFFRNFILERSGEHKDRFDIKLRAMMPLADAARVLTIDAGTVHITNTMERFQAAGERESANRQLYNEAAEAYGLYLRLRTRTGLRHHNSGRYIDPRELSKIERQTLRNSFTVIEEVQKILEVRYQLDYLR